MVLVERIKPWLIALAVLWQPSAVHAEKKFAIPGIEPPANPRNIMEMVFQKYSKQIADNPHDYVAYYRRGKIYIEKDDLSNAIADMKNSLKFNPYRETMRIGMVKMNPDLNLARVTAAWTHQYLAYLYCTKRSFVPGIEELDKAIAIRPAFAGNYLNRSKAYRALGRPDDARADEVKYKDLWNHPIPDDCAGTAKDGSDLKGYIHL
jgi:tetratricopeptide (TPR) repeat protein